MEHSDCEPTTQETVWQTVKGDFASTTGLRALGVVGLLAWMAFQWGWGNDILLPPIVTRTFGAVDNGTTWPSAAAAIVAGTGMGGLFWGITQTLDAIIVLAGLRLVPGITNRISTVLSRQGWMKPVHQLSLGTKFLIAFASGASMLCLVDVFATGQQGLRARLPLIAEAVALAVAGVGVAIAMIVTITAVGRRVPATADQAELVLRYAQNPLTWFVIYGTAIGLSSGWSRWRRPPTANAPAD